MTDTDFNQWKTELALPPVENCLRLCDYLPAETQAFLTSSGLPEEVLVYTWQEEVTYERVARWGRAAVLAGQVKKPDDSGSFFMSAIKDAYDYDRAVRAAKVLDRQPTQRKDIPQEFKGMNARRFRLAGRDFTWTPDTPQAAVDATALLLETEPPDALWIADYIEAPYTPEAATTVRKDDPVIYAVYGRWDVEVARWE